MVVLLFEVSCNLFSCGKYIKLARGQYSSIVSSQNTLCRNNFALKMSLAAEGGYDHCSHNSAPTNINGFAFVS